MRNNAEMIKLSLAEPTKPRILTSSEDKEVLELVSTEFRIGRSLRILSGGNVTLKCEALGIPPPRVTWRKDGKVLNTVGSLLELTAISLSDAGLYTCTALSNAGSTKESTSLSVKGE